MFSDSKMELLLVDIKQDELYGLSEIAPTTVHLSFC